MYSAASVHEGIVSGALTRERCCDDKVRFKRYTVAEKVRVEIEARHNEPGSLYTYACPFCGCWHYASTHE